MCCKTTCKVLPAIFIIIALVLAVLVTFMAQRAMPIAVNVSRFFEVMIPVLAVGALIKYIVGCHHEDTCCHGTTEEKK
jgi:hypothetical protein